MHRVTGLAALCVYGGHQCQSADVGRITGTGALGVRASLHAPWARNEFKQGM